MLPQTYLNQKISSKIFKKPQEHFSYSSQKMKRKDFLTQFSRQKTRNSIMDTKKRNKSVGQYERYGRSESQQDTQQSRSQKRRSRNMGYISHLFSVLRRSTTNNDSKQILNQPLRSNQKGSTVELKGQLFKVTTTSSNLMAPNKIIRSSKSPKKRVALSSLSKEKTKQKSQISKISITPALVEINSKHMKEYSKYIESQIPYQTKISYKKLRQLQKLNAFQEIDLKQYKILQSINLCIIDSLNGDQPSSQTLIFEYCELYFQNQERRKFEVVTNHHIFKTFTNKVKFAYVYERIWYFFVAFLSQNKIIFCEKAIEIAAQGLKLVDRLIKSLFEAVSENLNKNISSVLEAFKSLKSVKDIQNIITEFEKLLTIVEKLMCKQQEGIFTKCEKFYSQFSETLSNLRPFLIQSPLYTTNFQEYLVRIQTILAWKFLFIPPIPYLPSSPIKKYTLILGLDKVIILYNPATRILKYRPYMDTFLSRLKPYYEIIIFSDFQKELTNRIVKQIQRDEVFFSARLYRTHMSYKNGRIIKDLSKIGRDFKQIIFLDNSFLYLGQYPQNELAVPEFKTSNNSSLIKQKTLVTIMNKLLSFKQEYPQDIRNVLRKNQELYHIPQVATIQEKSIDCSQNQDVIYGQ